MNILDLNEPTIKVPIENLEDFLLRLFERYRRYGGKDFDMLRFLNGNVFQDCAHIYFFGYAVQFYGKEIKYDLPYISFKSMRKIDSSFTPYKIHRIKSLLQYQ